MMLAAPAEHANSFTRESIFQATIARVRPESTPWPSCCRCPTEKKQRSKSEHRESGILAAKSPPLGTPAAPGIR